MQNAMVPLLPVPNQQYYYPDDLLEEKEYQIDPNRLSGIQRGRYLEIKQHVEGEFTTFRLRAQLFLSVAPNLPQNVLDGIPLRHLGKAVIYRFYQQGFLWDYPRIQKVAQLLLNVLGKLSIALSLIRSLLYISSSDSPSNYRFLSVMSIPNISQIAPHDQSVDIVFGKNYREFSLNITPTQMEFFLDELCPYQTGLNPTPRRSTKILHQAHKILIYGASGCAWLIRANYLGMFLVYYTHLNKQAIYFSLLPDMIYYYLQCYESIEKTIMDFFTSQNPILKLYKNDKRLFEEILTDFALNIFVQWQIFERLILPVASESNVALPALLILLARLGNPYHIFCTRNVSFRDALAPYEFTDPFGFRVTYKPAVDSQNIPDAQRMSLIDRGALMLRIMVKKPLPMGVLVYLLLLDYAPDLAIWGGLITLRLAFWYFERPIRALDEAQKKRQVLDTHLNVPQNGSSNPVSLLAVAASTSDKILRVMDFSWIFQYLLNVTDLNVTGLISRSTQFVMSCTIAIPAMFNEFQFQTPRVINSLGKLLKGFSLFCSARTQNNNPQNNPADILQIN